MRIELSEKELSRICATTICRLFAEGTRWRVRVESWEAEGGASGRFVFEPDDPSAAANSRQSGPALRAERREDVIRAAYDIPERRLRELLHSLA